MATESYGRIELSKVYLDNVNPRHDPIDNEPEIIARFISKEYVKQLASDIVKRGRTSRLSGSHSCLILA